MPWMGRHRARLLLSLRILIASLATFAVAHLLGLAQSYWAVLTAVIVMQASVGGAVQATVERLLGSLGGAVWGVVVCLVVPHAGFAGLAMALGFAVAPLAVATAFNPAWRIAPVTAIILLLTPTSQAQGPVAAAVHRMLEVGLGSVVAVIVALLLAPRQATLNLIQAGCKALEAMAELIGPVMAGLSEARDPGEVEGLHARIRAAIAEGEAAAAQARGERAISLTGAPDPAPLCRTLRRMHHDLVMVGRATLSPLPGAVGDALAAPAAAAAAAVSGRLLTLAAALRDGGSASRDTAGQTALANFAAAVKGVRTRGLSRALTDDAVARLFGLTFALEQLGQDLSDLVERTGELSAHA